MIRALLIILTISISSSSLAAKIEFKIKGKLQSTLDVSTSKLTRSVTVLEPHMDQLVTYEGRPFNEIMDEALGSKWRKDEEVLFTCLDGYQSSIPVKKFQSFKAWLVWARNDGKPFEITNKLQNNEKISLGPIYLVWQNQNEPELLEGGANDFPYQVANIDIISFKERFPKIAPPAASDSQVQEGFLYFRKYCLNCHAIDGEGGKKAPDLKQLNPVKKFSHAELRRWILAPSKVKPVTVMPPFAPKLKNREQAADQVINYLEAILRPVR